MIVFLPNEMKHWWDGWFKQLFTVKPLQEVSIHWQHIHFEQEDRNRDTTSVLVFSLNFHGFILFRISRIHAHKSKCFQNLWIHECFHFLTKRFRRRWDSEWILLTIRTEPVPVSLEFLRCDAVWMLCRYMLLWALTERTYLAVRDIFSPTYLCVCVCVRWRRYSCQEGRHYDPSLPAWPC